DHAASHGAGHRTFDRTDAIHHRTHAGAGSRADGGTRPSAFETIVVAIAVAIVTGAGRKGQAAAAQGSKGKGTHFRSPEASALQSGSGITARVSASSANEGGRRRGEPDIRLSEADVLRAQAGTRPSIPLRPAQVKL